MDNCAEKAPTTVSEMDALLRRIVDYEAVGAKVKAYDRDSFRRWQEEERGVGTDNENMVRIFSGWSNLTPKDRIPRTNKDEARVDAWLSA